MRTEKDVVLALYDALGRQDLNEVFALLHPDCEAHICPGMPAVQWVNALTPAPVA